MGVQIRDAATGSFRPLSDVMKDVMVSSGGIEDGAGKVPLPRTYSEDRGRLLSSTQQGMMGLGNLR